MRFNIQTKYQPKWPDHYRPTIEMRPVALEVGAASHPTKALNCTSSHSRSGAHPRLRLSKSHGHHRWKKKQKTSRCGKAIVTRPDTLWTWAFPCPRAVNITRRDRRRSRLGGIWCPAKCAWLTAKCTVSCAHTDRLRWGQRLAVLLERQRFSAVSRLPTRKSGHTGMWEY